MYMHEYEIIVNYFIKTMKNYVINKIGSVTQKIYTMCLYILFILCTLSNK